MPTATVVKAVFVCAGCSYYLICDDGLPGEEQEMVLSKCLALRVPGAVQISSRSRSLLLSLELSYVASPVADGESAAFARYKNCAANRPGNSSLQNRSIERVTRGRNGRKGFINGSPPSHSRFNIS